MSGFDNDIVFAKNADFTSADNQSVSESNGLVINGQLWIGSAALNAGGTHINVGTLTSPGGTVLISYSSPNITLAINPATVGQTITGNSGGALSPTAGNWNTLGTGSITIAGSGSTLTTQLTGLTNHNVLIGAGTATITKVAPSATTGVALVSQGAAADPVFGSVSLTAGVTGVLPIANGGTNASSFSTTNGLAKFDGTSLVSSTTATLDASNRLVNTAQPCFFARVSGSPTATTGNGAAYTVIFDVSVFDQGSNYNTSTGIFTAPVTGRYLFTTNVAVSNLVVANNNFYLSLSNIGVATYIVRPGNIFLIANADGETSMNGQIIINMNANETFSVILTVTGNATANVTVFGQNNSTWLCGQLVC